MSRKERKTLRALGGKGSPDARKRAAAILEVLAGARTPKDAAQVIGCTVSRYYQHEARALEGFLASCEPARPGRGLSPARELTALEKKCHRLELERARQQALARLVGKTCGLPAPAPLPKGPGKRRARGPKTRALLVATTLAPASEPPTPPPTSSESS